MTLTIAENRRERIVADRMSHVLAKQAVISDTRIPRETNRKTDEYR